jgi:hypothetical protein
MPRNVFSVSTSTRHITARLPSDLVRKIDRAAQAQLRTRSQQLKYDLQRCYTSADSQPASPKEPRK